jgi:hypothetical protein
MIETGRPHRRFGRLRAAAQCGALPFVLLIPFVYWNLLWTPPWKISRETTFITEPLTRDGKRVDYFAALERELYPPQMKTDDNGYRLIVRALGDARTDGTEKLLTDQTYEKLGLDPTTKPVLSYIESNEFLRTYCKTKGISEEKAEEWENKLDKPWTLDDFPMMEPWLQQNGPALDMLATAVRKSTYCIPLVRSNEDATFVEILVPGEMQRTRSFARSAAHRASYRIGTGDVDGAMDDVITCERLGRHTESQSTLVARLVGIAVEGIAVSRSIATGKSQPSKEQLQRFQRELDQLPPRPSMERSVLSERYYVLDVLQGMAAERQSLTAILSTYRHSEESDTGIAAYVSVDWNTVMSRVNARYDDWEHEQALRPWTLLSPSSLFIGARSRRVADLVTDFHIPVLPATCEAIRRACCTDNLRRIALAMLMYEREHGALPPAYSVDANNRPLHSWRVLLLPYLDEKDLFAKLRLDEPWDSQHNRRFHGASVPIYQCPSAALRPGQTTYSVIVGEKTAFRGGQGRCLADLGVNTVLVVEREQMRSGGEPGQTVCWMDPMSELSQSIALGGINRRNEDVSGVGSPHPGGLIVSLRDGSVQYVSDAIELSSFQALIEGTANEFPY